MRIKLLSIMIIGILITSSSFSQVLIDQKPRVKTTNSSNVSNDSNTSSSVQQDEDFKYLAEQFADLRLIRYRIPGWDQLTLKQKKLVYFLTQAGYSGRDIIWDQNYRHNLVIRHTLEKIVNKYNGNKNDEDWKYFMEYTKRVWFSSGIHHHYSNDKILPEFSMEYFNVLLRQSHTNLDQEVINAMFDP